MNRIRNSCFLLVLALSSLGHADFLRGDEIALFTVLPPPPIVGSVADRTDMAAVEGWQVRRSPLDCARAERVEHVSLTSAFGGPEGPLTPAELKKWDPLFHEIAGDAEKYIASGKKHWARPRPFVTNPSLNLCVDRQGVKPSFGYPSGHATLSRVFALVLAELDSTRKEAFLARANQIAEDRVMAGVHYPTDIRAGRKLADAIFAALEKNADFRSRISAARN